ncbi:Chromatin assembly factor 1 subunit A [Metarhizium album ARSEF 1941]|uniref:Chromatin assembly factor 1 subunit A n=1 Tax=Metarhizium album (strain ARSEF 1941) TaxID=1081103 RepID=A0A0B2X6Q3_METAS|nr:Chromatin assembly factor 1 subunit A [Metarhizium album ARSEF 1941]KHO01438.1 Chromatin assembly factor 1 subunit A [Metarhizium album ARSEF 1941]
MPHNVQETEAVVRKRCHDEFAGDTLKIDGEGDAKSPKSTAIGQYGDGLPPQVQSQLHSSPAGSPAFTEAGSSTPARNSPNPITPTKATVGNNSCVRNSPDTMVSRVKGTASKRKRLTTVEKVAKDREQAEKKKEREELTAKRAAERAKQEEEKAVRAKEREEQAAAKAKEKAKLEEEKAARAKEREERRKQKEEEDRLKAEQRDEKKRKKEEEQRRIQEERDRRARSQPKLNEFFKIPGVSKKSDNGSSSAAGSPIKAARGNASVQQLETEYDRLFKPFFVRENTRLAPSATQMDEETREAKSRNLDSFLDGQRNAVNQKPLGFDPVEALLLPGRAPRRGRIHHPVKHIMETTYRNAAGASDANNIFQEARQKLASIPQKVITFSQDVRPPYYGTVTFKPYALGRDAMFKLARKPTKRRLPLDYDYDSEAEWQEEEGEDIDMEDEEEELDDDDDMDGFLDDTDDGGLSRRAFGNAMEPECTGVCYENYNRLGPNRTVYEHKMEFIHEGLEDTWGIDPFSSQYWETEVKAQPVKVSLSATESAAKMPPPPAPTNAFAALDGCAANVAASAKLVKPELLNDFKRAILDNKALSKVGIIDFIFHQFRSSVSRAEVRNTLEHVAEKKGAGRSKEWDLKPGHEIVF